MCLEIVPEVFMSSDFYVERLFGLTHLTNDISQFFLFLICQIVGSCKVIFGLFTVLRDVRKAETVGR